jgi:hypothetical protein
MQTYIYNMVTHNAKAGQVVELEPTDEATRSLLERGIIREHKTVEPEETKAPRARKAKA